jgi:hypothetical protein
MLDLWHRDFESLEQISQDALARRLFLRMATLCQEGRLDAMVEALEDEEELDPETRSGLAELASDRTFLFTVRDYLRRTHVAH